MKLYYAVAPDRTSDDPWGDPWYLRFQNQDGKWVHTGASRPLSKNCLFGEIEFQDLRDYLYENPPEFRDFEFVELKTELVGLTKPVFKDEIVQKH